jgi:hypothetical protein
MDSRIELQIEQIAKRHGRRLFALSLGLMLIFGSTFLTCIFVRERLQQQLPDGATNMEIGGVLLISLAVMFVAYVLIKRFYSVRCPSCSAQCKMRLFFQDASLYCENVECGQVIPCNVRF